MGLIDRRRAIVLFGDSLTQRSFEPSGWGAALAHLYGRRCDVYNRGFGGYNTRWCRSMVGELVPAHETPLLATVLLGTNDAALFDVEPAAHVPLEEYEDNLTAIVTHVKKRCVHVIVLTPPCMDERQRLAFQKEKYGADALGALDRRNANTKRYAEVATRVAETLDVPCVDLFEATWKACASSSTRSDGVSRQNSVDPWAEPPPPPPPTETNDARPTSSSGVHFSAFGQELVFRALTEGIRKWRTAHHARRFTSLDPESMDSDWPFGPTLRGRPRRGGTRCTRTRGARASRRRCFRRRRRREARGARMATTSTPRSRRARKQARRARGRRRRGAGAGYALGLAARR